MTKPKASTTAAPAAVVDKSRTIDISRKDGETEDQAVANVMVRGTLANSTTIIDYSRAQHAGLSLTDIAQALKEQGEAVNRGDLASLERMLTGQAVALNAMFTELARRGALNMGEHLGATETYIRLALKAQSQSRATAETLAAIKNPPIVYARQMNVANGPQQVNNGAAPPQAANYAQAHASAHAGENVSQLNELLEDHTHGRAQLDTRATARASRAHQEVEAVAAVNRAAQC